MHTIMADSTPPQINSIFAVPQSSWEMLNKRAYLFTQPDYAQSFTGLYVNGPDWDELSACNQDWCLAWFKQLIIIVQEILDFSPNMTTMRQNFEALAVHGANYAGFKTIAFQHLHETVLPGLSHIDQQVQWLQNVIKSLVTANLSADMDPNATSIDDNLRYYEVIDPNEDYQTVDNAVGTIAGGWASLHTELNSLTSQIGNDDPNSDFIERIKVLGADETWKATIAGATTFLAMQPALEECLDGRYMYRYLPVVPNVWYYLSIDFNMGNLHALYAATGYQPGNPISTGAIILDVSETHSEPDDDWYQWQFQVLNCGYLQVLNKKLGSGFALTPGYNGQVTFAPAAQQGADLLAQAWRLYDMNRNNVFRLVPWKSAPTECLVFTTIMPNPGSPSDGYILLPTDGATYYHLTVNAV